MAELKPCKWCEIVDNKMSEGKLEQLKNEYFIILCKKCGWFTDSYKTEEEAISAWNKRS